MDTAISIAASTLILISGALVFWLRKRRFDRTNEAGIERFPSFRKKVASGMVDIVIRACALILGCAGILLLAFQFHDSWGWIILTPVAALLLFYSL